VAVTREEMDERIRAIAAQVEKPEAEIRGLLNQGRRRANLESDLLDEKSMAFLRGRATVKTG
jgi:hypothetical protein